MDLSEPPGRCVYIRNLAAKATMAAKKNVKKDPHLEWLSIRIC